MSRKEVIFEPEYHYPIPYPEIDGWDEDIVETAGFIPLEVRFKQMEQAGIRAQFFESEFGSKDFSDMYLNHPEFDLTPEDDIEEAFEKIQLRQEWINYVKNEAKKRKESSLSDSKLNESEAKEKQSETKEEKVNP